MEPRLMNLLLYMQLSSKKTAHKWIKNKLILASVTTVAVCQSCSLGLDVSVSRPSRDVFFKRLGLVSVSAKCGEVSVSVSSRTESQTSRSRLGLGPQGLVYKWAFKQIFQFLSFSYSSSVGLHLFNDGSFATLRPLALQLFSLPCSSAASESLQPVSRWVSL